MSRWSISPFQNEVWEWDMQVQISNSHASIDSWGVQRAHSVVTASMEVCQVACSVTFIPAEHNITNDRDTIEKKASIRNGTVWH